MFRFTRRLTNLTIKVRKRHESRRNKPNFALRFRQSSTKPQFKETNFLLGLLAGTAFALGGMIVYAHHDEKFRVWITNSVPEAAMVFDYFLGPMEDSESEDPPEKEPVKKVKEPVKKVKEPVKKVKKDKGEGKSLKEADKNQIQKIIRGVKITED